MFSCLSSGEPQLVLPQLFILRLSLGFQEQLSSYMYNIAIFIGFEVSR